MKKIKIIKNKLFPKYNHKCPYCGRLQKKENIKIHINHFCRGQKLSTE